MNFAMTQTVSKTGFLKSKDQTPLFYRYYPLQGHKASVVLAHGYGEHSGRYLHVIERLLQDRFEVLSLDLRGHGYSEGRRGDIDSFACYEDDVIAAIDYAAQHRLPGKKLFLIAHSMGALVSLHVVTRMKPLPIDGMVMSCPLLGLTMSMPAWKQFAAETMSKVVPTLRLSAGIKGRQLSKDMAIAKAYDSDPLILKSLSARTFWELFKSFSNAASMAAHITMPFLMQVGGKDSVVDPRASERWFSYVNRDKVDATFKIYPELMHEIYNEADRHIPIEDAITWLNARV